MAGSVLVTGGCGFIGGWTVDGLVERGYEVTVLDTLEPQAHPQGLPRHLNLKAKLFVGDIREKSEEIVLALSEAGYQSDFSLPCWEPFHPVTAAGSGIHSLHSFEIGNISESPLTLVQDHQVLSILGMTPEAVVEFLIDEAKLIRSYNGDIVLLVHTDYAFSRDLKAYNNLLTSLMEIHDSSSTERDN